MKLKEEICHQPSKDFLTRPSRNIDSPDESPSSQNKELESAVTLNSTLILMWKVLLFSVFCFGLLFVSTFFVFFS